MQCVPNIGEALENGFMALVMQGDLIVENQLESALVENLKATVSVTIP